MKLGKRLMKNGTPEVKIFLFSYQFCSILCIKNCQTGFKWSHLDVSEKQKQVHKSEKGSFVQIDKDAVLEINHHCPLGSFYFFL